MLFKSLRVQNFRNHNDLSIEFPKKLYIEGDNGAGKTSIIESIYILHTLKTFRKQRLQEIKKFDTDFFRIHGFFEKDNVTHDLLFYYDESKVIKFDNNPLTDVGGYLYNMPVICYSPDYESLLSSQHQLRRQFLDRVIFYFKPSHFNDLITYNALIKRKKAELIKITADKLYLKVLDEQLSDLSTSISKERYNLIKVINELIAEHSVGKDSYFYDMKFSLTVSSINNENIDNEIHCKKALYGCHRDILHVKKNGKFIEKFQSFGQKKSFLLFCLYTLVIYIEKISKNSIIVLLDDFEAGLDDDRIFHLYEKYMDVDRLVLTGIRNTKNKSINTIRINDVRKLQ